MIKIHKRGFSVVEIIVAAAIIVVVVTSITGAMQLYLRLVTTNSQYVQAALLTEEAAEALQIFRDKGWINNISLLASNVPIYLYWNATQYATSSSPVYIQNIYTRSLIFKQVIRDSNFNIASNGTYDNNTRDVTVNISTGVTSPTTLMQTKSLIHNVYNN